MAKKRKQKTKAAAKRLVFGRKNWLVLLGGVLIIVLGFFVLSTGSITLAPILLVLGYCVIVPLAILIR